MTRLSYKYLLLISAVFFLISFSNIVAMRRRKVSSAAKPKTSVADRQVENVRYSAGSGGGSVGLGQNIDYEIEEYQDVYEEPK